MTMKSAMQNARCDALVDALRAEFGAILAGRILESEAADFLWEARLKERYLGQHVAIEEDGEELSRIAVLSLLDGKWHAALCLVDGEGRAVDLLWKRQYGDMSEALAAFERAA